MQRPKRRKMAKPAALAMAEASAIPLEIACRDDDGSPGPHRLFLPTLRDAPADAEAVSHKLLVRGGFIRQLGAGLWTFTPLGWRVHRKVEQIIREEMDAIGAQEWLAPVLTPIELWEATGRDRIPEIFHVTDRAGRRFLLPLTHEETFTFHAREIQSYRELPQSWYHFQTKDRDEPRPRGGLIRVREFIMKDSYSFDRDEAGLERELPRARAAPTTRIFQRCGLEYHAVQAESGMMGGSESVDFLAPSGSGENTLVTCENGDFAADLEVARGVPRAARVPAAAATPPSEVETPGVDTIEALAELLGIDLAATSKAMPMTKDDGTVVLALVRGDDRLEEAKLARRARSGGPARRPRTRSGGVRRRSRLARPGRVRGRGRSPTRRFARASSSPARTGPAGTCAASSAAATSRPASPTSASRVEGDRCPNCGGALRFQTAIEIGHIFKLGTRYSVPLEATFLDEDGREKPLVMGSYGIGPGRIMAAAVEQSHDEHGIGWPALHRAVRRPRRRAARRRGAGRRRPRGSSTRAGLDVLLDDRDLRAGREVRRRGPDRAADSRNSG